MKKVDYNWYYPFIQPLANINIKGTNRLAKLISKLIIPKADQGGVIIKTMHGFWMQVDPVKDKGVERSLYYLGTYESGTLNIIENILSPGDVVVDIGANIGLMTLFASFIVGNEGRVYSFEANPDTMKILEFNLNLNNIRNVVTSPFALGAEKGDGKIFANWHINRGGASLLQSDESSEFHPVKIERLDALKEFDLSQVNLMKLDIEGYEFQALKGCGDILKRENAPMLIIEYNRRGQPNDEIFDYLKKINSYRIYIAKGQGYNQRVSPLQEVTKASQIPDHENIFCFLQPHLAKISQKIFR